MGINEVRIRYRYQLRNLIRQIITELITEHEFASFVETQVQQLIPNHDRVEFIKNVYEELDNIGPERIVSMGITANELNAWLAKNK